MSNSKHVSRRRRWWVAGGAVFLVVAAVLVVVLTGVLDSSSDEAAPPEPTPAPSTSASPTPTPESEVSIEETQTMPYTPVWNPPDAGDDFWQVVDADEGYPEDGGTDYILAHACRDRECAGDRIRDLEVEDSLDYRGEQYVVEEKLEILKTEIGEQDIWSHDPDRLVVITCILDPETGDYDENDIIVATRAG
ncbi:hypothetical protein ACHAAC_10720 [Aeromicrobium sp. CF4.19]|uniref:hypothetical protein n=1 Tax=Aeromicrobium sp. CF4.19 TaxID=3373082 RepID=UPI003EE430DE